MKIKIPQQAAGVLSDAEKEGLPSVIPWGGASKQSDQTFQVFFIYSKPSLKQASLGFS